MDTKSARTSRRGTISSVRFFFDFTFLIRIHVAAQTHGKQGIHGGR